jgi:triphosphoribosyl-dephospho-CoA synthetase
VKDTNIISRSDIDTQNSVQKEIKRLIELKGIENITIDEINETDNKFIQMNISPGGCADLLAITYMFCFIQSAVEDE